MPTTASTRRKVPPVGKSAVMMAAALQDHFMRSTKVAKSMRIKAPQPKPADPEDLDGPEPELTLAQRMGLVKAPPPRMSAADWLDVETQAREREQTALPCPICREEFKDEQQVLLSCSHIFHRSCIESFEKFSGSKSCPLCRCVHYQKRKTEEGKRFFEVRCATKLQATYRGHLARRLFDQIRDAVGVPEDPFCRRAYFSRRLARLTDALIDDVDENDDIDKLFAECDSTLALSRATFGAPLLSQAEWREAQEKAVRRGDHECAICIAPLQCQGRQQALLSCSHTFHLHCIEAFEEFSGEAQPRCPVCRSGYAKMALVDQEEADSHEPNSHSVQQREPSGRADAMGRGRGRGRGVGSGLGGEVRRRPSVGAIGAPSAAGRSVGGQSMAGRGFGGASSVGRGRGARRWN